MIRDEYSDEVGDLWDAFSKALRHRSRDWMHVGTPPIHPLQNVFGIDEAELQRRNLMALQMNQYASRQAAYSLPPSYEPQPLLGGMFGNLF